MRDPMTLQPIGRIEAGPAGARLQLDEPYRPALSGLAGFSHVLALWWFSRCDTPEARATLEQVAPYPGGPDRLGTYATRSPLRPNPIAVSVAEIVGVDEAAGRVEVGYLDADAGTPLLDLKPYTPSLDRVEDPAVPDWCALWPRSLEESARFDWSAVFG